MDPMLSLEAVQARIRKNPFNEWLGIEVLSLDDPGIQLRMPRRVEIVGKPTDSVIHGGVLGCLLDTCGAFAIIARTGHTVSTVDMRVDFHRPAMSEWITAQGAIVKLGKTMGTVDVRMFDSDQKLVASGRALYLNVSLPAPSDT